MPDARSAATYDELFALTVAEAERKGLDIADTTPPVRRRCVVNGSGLHFLDWLGEGLPPMLLLHGALLNAHVWDLFSLQMRRQFHIRSIDLPGHGDSDWRADHDYSRGRASADVGALIEQLELSSVVLVGHSFGGAVGALASAQLSQRIRALVMVDSTLMPTGRPSVRSRAAEAPRTYASLEEFAAHAAGLTPRGNPARVSVSLRWNAQQLADGRWTWKFDPALLSTPTPSVAGPSNPFEDIWTALRAFPHPVLFVRAGKHSHVTDEAAERLQALPNLHLTVVPEATHNVMTADPVHFTREVADFLLSTSSALGVSI